MRPVVLVILLNVGYVAAVIATYALGQSYAPEMMDSQAMSAPLVLSFLGLGGWLLYWSVQTLSGSAKKQDD
jgi:hypothetical protein